MQLRIKAYYVVFFVLFFDNTAVMTHDFCRFSEWTEGRGHTTDGMISPTQVIVL